MPLTPEPPPRTAEPALPHPPEESNAKEWRNWSGSVVFRPSATFHPRDEAEVLACVRRARGRGERLRVIGTGHSSSDILYSSGSLVSLDRLRGVVAHDRAGLHATLRAGTTITEAGEALLKADLGLPNVGDVSSQTLAGAVATGTHGTGPRFTNLSGYLVGARLVAGNGEVVDIDEEQDGGELLRAARVSLGVLGIFTELRLRLVPAGKLQRREYCSDHASSRRHFERLAEGNLHFDFYWYPRSDCVKLRLLNPPGGGTCAPPGAVLDEDRSGWAHQIVPKHTGIRLHFEECEYHFERAAGLACFEEVRLAILRKWRALAGWRVLVRWVARDDGLLSPCHGRETLVISVHQSVPLEFDAYFRAMEVIFQAHGGRPHWAKKHGLRGPALRALYPRFERFAALRRRLDPQGVFLNPYFEALFGREGR